MTRVNVTARYGVVFSLAFAAAGFKAKAEFARQAAGFEAELLALRDEFHELALAHRRRCYDAAISEAMLQRALDPDMLMH
jgi:hypothetical protein